MTIRKAEPISLPPSDTHHLRRACDYCGLEFSGTGYSPDADSAFCCYGCYLVSRIVGYRGDEGLAASIILRLGIGAFLSMNVMMISLVLYTVSPVDLGSSTVQALRWTMLVLSTPAVAILGAPILRCGLRDALRLRLGTDALVATGAFAAYFVSGINAIVRSGEVYFDTATMLLLILTLGRLMEASAKSRTSKAIGEMTSLAPENARVVRHSEEVEIPTGELREGDFMLVRPGEMIPADGVVLSGRCLVEETAFTGEAAPRSCEPGDSVFGGSIDCDGAITVQATAVGRCTLAARIEEMVLHARRERAPVERLAERVAGVFVPAVWLVSAGAAVYWGVVQHDSSRAWIAALAVLVAACPCALGLATPMAACLAIGAAAKRGVLIRSGEVLERLPRIKRVFFDKTGTLTRGNLTVHDICTIPGVSAKEVAQWAAPLEASSGHVIGQAIATLAGETPGVAGGTARNVKTIPGLGVEGEVDIGGKTRRVTVGVLALLQREHALAPEMPPLCDEEPFTAAYVGWDGLVQGMLLLSDEPRAEAAETILALKAMGISTAVVSGDRQAPTSRLADELGVGSAFAECSPEDKAALVRKASGTGAAFVGDGINDAPALSSADVGIAVGSGTDLAREVGDVVLLGDDLSRIPELVSLSRLTYAVIRQNLIFSFGYNTLAVALACAGFVHPLIAATAMLASSLCVISNSMRVSR